ncbi:uncharacterized protein EAF02_012143 [Botrytis sinoallii]|uniref:uncharacterized protein n=1 Tax=Botrytis sinoallii TaxID=1463999 RepID=UPI0018FFB854|nr:uncharacterized protein EAF02_012143 [Botrytis sinoallii]KAF7852744.1 hypothetical protein EAF02_012143 [Botrytis sinoallii]
MAGAGVEWKTRPNKGGGRRFGEKLSDIISDREQLGDVSLSIPLPRLAAAGGWIFLITPYSVDPSLLLISRMDKALPSYPKPAIDTR